MFSDLLPITDVPRREFRVFGTHRSSLRLRCGRRPVVERAASAGRLIGSRQKGTFRRRAFQPRDITPSHEYYCSNNGNDPCNLQKLQNNDLFPVAYSTVIILYRGVQTP
jgi:hypothetical protein